MVSKWDDLVQALYRPIIYSSLEKWHDDFGFFDKYVENDGLKVVVDQYVGTFEVSKGHIQSLI